jgi:hypothetical protein
MAKTLRGTDANRGRIARLIGKHAEQERDRLLKLGGWAPTTKSVWRRAKRDVGA